MYERFTERAKKVLELAMQEAQRFNHEYIGTEHVLLGLVKEGSGVGANVLRNMDVDLEKVRLEVEKIVQKGPDMVSMGKLPQTPRAKKVVEYAIEEARSLGHNYVGTEHILLGLLREQEGVAARVLMNLGLKLDDVREEVLNLLGAEGAGKDASAQPARPLKVTVRAPGPASLPGEKFPWLEWVRDALNAPDMLEAEGRAAEVSAQKGAAAEREDYETALQKRDEERALHAELSRRASLVLLRALLARPDDSAYAVLRGAGLDVKAAKERIDAALEERAAPEGSDN